MSSFLCSDLHTAVCAVAISSVSHKPAKAIYSQLRSLNNAALAARYGDKRVNALDADLNITAAHAYLDARPDNTYKNRVIFSLLQCLDYQCDEGAVMKTHKYAKVLKDGMSVYSDLSKGMAVDGVWSI